jgi:hypothetical protein
MYAITHRNRDGMRILTFPNQGRNHYDTQEAAVQALQQFRDNGSIRNVIGETGYRTLEVRPVTCYDHGDAVGIYFDDGGSK